MNILGKLPLVDQHPVEAKTDHDIGQAVARCSYGVGILIQEQLHLVSHNISPETLDLEIKENR